MLKRPKGTKWKERKHASEKRENMGEGMRRLKALAGINGFLAIGKTFVELFFLTFCIFLIPQRKLHIHKRVVNLELEYFFFPKEWSRNLFLVHASPSMHTMWAS
jgi:hypothetical protein